VRANEEVILSVVNYWFLFLSSQLLYWLARKVKIQV
jgi:hypothetical protein